MGQPSADVFVSVQLHVPDDFLHAVPFEDVLTNNVDVETGFNTWLSCFVWPARLVRVCARPRVFNDTVCKGARGSTESTHKALRIKPACVSVCVLAIAKCKGIGIDIGKGSGS